MHCEWRDEEPTSLTDETLELSSRRVLSVSVRQPLSTDNKPTRLTRVHRTIHATMSARNLHVPILICAPRRITAHCDPASEIVVKVLRGARRGSFLTGKQASEELCCGLQGPPTAPRARPHQYQWGCNGLKGLGGYESESAESMMGGHRTRIVEGCTELSDNTP